MISTFFMMLAGAAAPQGPVSFADYDHRASSALNRQLEMVRMQDLRAIDGSRLTVTTDRFDTQPSRRNAPQDVAAVTKKRSGFYLGLDSGLSKISGTTDSFFSTGESLKFDDTALIGGALGYRFSPYWRVEANASRRSTNVDTIDGAQSSGELIASSYILNAYFDLDTGHPFSPYIGAGLGVGSYKIEATEIDDTDDDTLNFNVMIGLNYTVNEHVEAHLEYRSLSMSDIFDTDIQIHEIVVGLRYTF
jgi:opacity protein-like surface antigen